MNFEEKSISLLLVVLIVLSAHLYVECKNLPETKEIIETKDTRLINSSFRIGDICTLHSGNFEMDVVILNETEKSYILRDEIGELYKFNKTGNDTLIKTQRRNNNGFIFFMS